MNEEKQFLKSLLEPFATLTANYEWQEQVKDNPPLEPESAFIQRKKDTLLDSLSEMIRAQRDTFVKAGAVLHEKLPSLPGEERDLIKKELEKAQEMTHSLYKNEKVKIDPLDTPQIAFGFSQATLTWIYQIGYECFKDKQYEEALSLFKTLTSFSPFVLDYKIAEGMTLKALRLNEEALFCFSIAATLDPSHPIPRYNSAELYLETNQIADAEAELQVLENILQSGKREDLKPAILALRKKLELY
jgi:tetratricopeptide (TPR) repeat protein